ncbi:hypothetical protein MMMIC1C10_08040 [Methanococcus maripaludis]|uniref:Putative formylmethanofuran dehydrogenase subunit E n=1 Tax=Methanococcus maripaludis KA1 TaxID=637914 RepID=A0A2Z5PQX6_METMI|nr:FmdE family protein [Methanococcus maripaludis]BAP61197.1 putative formylmethanofuran dehydrogenase subunit E [Methanococcus maripaludis KA1]
MENNIIIASDVLSDAVRLESANKETSKIIYELVTEISEQFLKNNAMVVAIVENNSCSIDGIQQMLGCTFGKGNLKFKDNGKHVYTFYSRGNDKALRIYLKYNLSEKVGNFNKKFNEGTLTAEDEKQMFERRKEAIKHLMEAPEEELFDVQWVEIEEPKKARLYPSLTCENCGETFMEIKGRTIDGKIVCKECFQKLVH